ncbi:hypothetical protein BSL78_11523 [Apostichopus japonicus]|uniref:Non-specific protein-tyrosine kinase n=1 Tax=Stichopus japonicus TaxID=307972 RepID=A0A2G8KUB4_STIJA|nr:hypothetical protein BSL78_11523 [Apostichopus japonicus]
MDSVSIPFIVFVCLVSRGYVSTTKSALCFKSDNVSDNLISCDVEIGDDLCLICPVNISNTHAIMWWSNENLIYAGVNKISEDETILQNTCHHVLSSIQLKNVSLAKFNNVYECRRMNQELVLITYKVSVIAKPRLTFVNYGNHALYEETTSLECRADGVLPPLTLTWLVNENIQRKELFNETVDHRVMSTYSFIQDGNSKTVECRVNGSHIKTASVTYSYQIPTSVAELDVQTEVVQVPKDGNKRGSTIALQTCLKVGKKFEYWTCTFGNDESEIFVKTLSVPSVYYEYITNGTLRDMLMSQYQEARKSYVLTNNKKQLPENMKSQVEVLLYLSCEVASAMVFLSSQKFCHPILSTRKVLLTDTGHCKLYDVCPENMAVSIVKEKLDKEYPPIMWMSPEAVFLKQYSVDSDIWNYGTFLWEIFSLGEVPYAGLSKLQLEEKIRQTIVLAQPICCPGALYSIMTLCWNTSIDHRPPFQTIFGKISTLLENVSQEEQVLRCKASDYYSSLEMS